MDNKGENKLDYMMQHDQQMLYDETFKIILKIKKAMKGKPLAYQTFKAVLMQAAQQ